MTVRSMEVVTPQPTKRLPRALHHFSVVIFREGSSSEKFHELGPTFYAQKENSFFDWNTERRLLVRLRSQSIDAVRRKTLRMLKKLEVNVAKFDYKAVVHTKDATGRIVHMRHVSFVTISDHDHDYLEDQKMLLPVRVATHEMSDTDAVVRALYSLQHKLSI